MPWFSQDSEEATAYGQVTGGQHHAQLSHELIAGAAAYEAARGYEKHVANNGKPVNHAEAKAIVAALAGSFIDSQAESRGLDFLAKEKAKREAERRAHECLADEYN